MGVQVAAANRGAHSPASASPGSPPKPAVRSAVVTRSASSLPPKTVVILFGWFGAQDRILRKYAELYEGNTDTTVVVRVIADPKDVLLSNKQGLLDVGYAAVEAAAAALRDGGSEAKLFVHVFSNGGAYVWEQLTQEMIALEDEGVEERTPRQQGLALVQERLSGEVFDSSPCYVSVDVTIKALNQAIPSFLPRVAMQMGMILLFLVMNIASLVNGKNRPKEFWNNMMFSPHTCKQMYIYGPRDDIANHVLVEEMIAARREIKVDASGLRFEDSDHVGHLRKHEAAYTAACLRFVGGQ